MENQNVSLDKELEIINNIRYLDFSGLDSFDIYIANKLLENENNLQYKESVECLQDFIFFELEIFNQKHRKFGIKEETIIDKLHDILEFLPDGTLKAKIASIILIEDRNTKYKKPELAQIIVENFVFDFDKIFRPNYIREENIYFTIDLAYKFQLFDELDIGNRIKQIFNEELNDIRNFKFTRLYQTLAVRFSIWNKNEHIEILHKLYKNAIKRMDELKTIIDIPQAQVEKDIICNILEVILFIVEKIKKYKTKKYRYIQNKIYKNIIDINLEFVSTIKIDKEIALDSLYYILMIANKQNNKELGRNINKKIQLLQKKISKTIEHISIPFEQEQRDIIGQYEKYLDNLLSNKINLFNVFRHADKYYVDFDVLQKNGSLARYLCQIIEYDSDGLMSNIHNQGDIFIDYKNCITAHSCLCYILKTKLLQSFYPQKEYFYPLTYNNNIIPKGYEELVAKMLYCGIHNDCMDFLIYAGVSIEAILRNILEKMIVKL